MLGIHHNIGQYVSWLVKHWWQTALYFIFAAIMALYVARAIPGMYQATVWVNFQQEAAGAGLFQQFTNNLLGLSRSQKPFDKLEHDLKLGVYSSSRASADSIANQLSEDYGIQLNQYDEYLSAYGDNPSDRLYYFTERHLRIVRHKDDQFFAFIWYFYDRELARQQLNSIVGYIEDGITQKLVDNFSYSARELDQIIPTIKQPQLKIQAEALSALYKSQRDLLLRKDSAIFKISPVEVSAGWVFPSSIKVMIALFAPMLIIFVFFVNWRLPKLPQRVSQ